jgi:hypothetical protein
VGKPDAGAKWRLAGVTTAIARREIAVHSPTGQLLYHISNHDAYLRVSNLEAYRIDEKAIKLAAPKSTFGKYSWAVRQSGYAGPLVLQVVT